jgi:hypothetical protein
MLIGYIDPSVMTFAVQAIAGAVIAIGAFVGIYYRKAKKKVNDKLGIDENSNKEVESDDIFDDDDEDEEEKPKKVEKKVEKKETTKPTPKKNNNKKKKSK